MYVCGPTVYNLIHIGNARPMICFDTVRRYLEYKGYDVNYVSNFTDVDDKIIKRPMKKVYLPKKFHSVISQSAKGYGRHEYQACHNTSACNTGNRRHD